jgi:hypothetical protein
MAAFGRVFLIFALLIFATLSGVMAQTDQNQQLTPTPTASSQTNLTLVENVPVTIALVGGAGPIDLQYTASESQTITVTARSETPDAIDTTLQILSADNENLGFNDDHDTRSQDLSSRDSVIEDLELPTAGIYIIRVDSFTGASTGNVIVTLDVAGNGRAVNEAAESIIVTDHLRSNRSYEITFDGNEGDVVTITARDLPDDDVDIDPLLTLLSDEGDVLAENDDHETRDLALDLFDARIESFVLPTNGTYTIQVDDYFGDPGEFELTIEFANVIASLSNGAIVVQGTVPAEESFEQTFAANEGDVITITAHASEDTLDPIVTLFDMNGEIIADNDDHDSEDTSLNRYDAQIAAFTIPATGTYHVIVTGYGTSFGDFTLTIELAN